ncbi:MAG: hypothetical protein Kow0031_37790 [Anaerolineae bacterium]
MRLIFTVLTVVMMFTLAAPVTAQEGGAATGRYWQSRGGISATGGGMVTSDQGRYRQRGSAGEVVASSGLGAGVSLGFWWRVITEDTTGDGPVRVYLPVIIKAGGQ